jgi:hypothetical protein
MYKIFRFLWRIFWNLKTIIITAVLLISLALNIVLFIGGSLFSIVNNGFEALTGIQTIASRNKAEITGLGEEIVLERSAKRELKGQLRDTSADLADTRITNRKLQKETRELSADLITERQVKRELRSQVTEQAAELTTFRVTNRQLKSQVRDFGMGVIPFKGKKVALKTAVDETADVIGKRAVKTAKREVTSMPAEAIPYLGTAVIVGVTALEIYDLCATLKDMSALKRAFNPDFMQSDEELEVCAIKVPPKEEILAAVKASPKKAWEAAKEATPSWSELQQLEVPDVTWSEMWSSTKEGTANTWDSTSESVNELSNKVKKWWTAD